ncbi:MAG: ferric reductase-like transmembrane domain-containing protein [Oceanospirillaceae bacterium]|nr:ferric reductase-like transmembrane domain-containing protein [Oceanospirillaceae bacterium]MCP5335431.1 ferric reductase-like transmembrane domain-containing protein [Oceanospirillaceae bacterium]MCP5349826.1 ferric reductase-like transmembrane domain-containing protein [Oceanospirillaceae bacterium]
MLNLLVWLGVLAPFFYIIYGIVQLTFLGNIFYFGPEPGQYILEWMGQSALAMLFATLMISSAHRLWALPIVRYRRRLGVGTFFYALGHLLAFAVFILGLDLTLLVQEIIKRPYILVGMTALVLLALLAVTSLHTLKRRLAYRWIQLHRLVYWVAGLGVLHYVWQIRDGYFLFDFYLLLLVLLLAERVKAKKVFNPFAGRKTTY